MCGRLQQAGEQIHWVALDRSRDREELDEVEASLAALVLRYERLRHAEPLGDLLLGQSHTVTFVLEQRDQVRVLGCAECLGHAPDPERSELLTILG